MSTSELDSRNIAISMRKSVENLVISSQDAIGQSISQALTFSGVITQQAHQMMQDTRNVSRSPSPSLRNSEGNDSLENDKQGEMAIHVPSHPAGDTVSVSSASDIAPSPSPAPANHTKPDGVKASTPNPARNSDPSARVKKKSWYTSLYPTYKSKSDDFKRLFKDLPDDERLIVDYSCALQKDILAHGRLYASQNYLCFYASIFGWETSMSLRWKDVTAITKEKTALVIPNAILVCTESEKNFLTSFSGRDKAYLMLFRVWQNALMDQPMTSQEIWQWVHSCYGEELGFGSDDEGYSRDQSLPTDPLPHIDGNELDLVDSSMEAVSGAETRDDRSRGGSRGRDSSPPLVTNGDTGFRGGGGEAEGDTLPTDMSDTSDSEDKPTDGEKCTSDHSGKQLMRGQFPFNIDQLFTMIFTSSKFNLELLAARNTTDYVQAPWQVAAGVKCRQISYVLGLTSGPIGPKEVHVTETQVMNKCSKPGHLYSIDSSSENTGIPYADYFTVEVHYCLSRVSEHLTDFSLTGFVKYKKSMWPMVKAFLEKNTMSGLEDFGRLMEARLAAEARGHVPAARAVRRHRRNIVSSSEAPVATVKPPPTILAPRASLPRVRPPHSSANSWLAAALAVLLVLNGLLYWRLYHPPHTEDLQTRMKTLGEPHMADWSALLDAHTRRQRGQLLAWREALDTTVAHLHQTELALRKLLETIEPSLAKADESDPPSEEADTDPPPSTPPPTDPGPTPPRVEL